MNDPATKDDMKVLVNKLDELGKSVEGMRSQNSAEHGSIYSIAKACLEGMAWIKSAWVRFSILPSPSPDKPKTGAAPTKDDTQ